MEKMSITSKNKICLEKGKKLLIKLKGDGTSMSNNRESPKNQHFIDV